MFRGTTARTVISVLTAALLALQLFAPTASFTSTHTVSQAKARAESGLKLSGKPPHDEILTSGHCVPSGDGDPADRPRSRGRMRGADSGSRAPEPPPPTRALATTHQPAGTGPAHPHTPRSSASHTPAGLQVFRC